MVPTFTKLPMEGLTLIQNRTFEDDRGFLSRLFCREAFTACNLDSNIVQINQSYTGKRGAIRGLHFQTMPFNEAKFVTCIRGSIYDVAVDLRFDSPTFLKWHSEVLSGRDFKTFFIPNGFAHGYQTLESHTEILYFHTAPYHAAAERGINFNDPTLGITWPLDVSELSEKDKLLPFIDDSFTGLIL